MNETPSSSSDAVLPDMEMVDAVRPARITYSHSVLAQCSLPRRRVAGAAYERRNGMASILIRAGEIWDPATEKWITQPLPYGTRPRLTLFHLSAEAVRTRQRMIEVGHSTREFLLRLGIGTGGREYARFQSQMTALAACDMRFGVGATTILNAKPIAVFEPWARGSAAQRALLPGVITLSSEYFESLLERAVPLDLGAVKELKSSSLALDVYTWLAHRLWRVRSAGERVSWSNILDQFGAYQEAKYLRREMLDALAAVMRVYPAARVERVHGGLLLMPSPPPVPRSMVSVRLPKA